MLTLYTRCPQCQQPQTVSIEQLRSSRGVTTCHNCSNSYDALEFISDNPNDLLQQEPENGPFLLQPQRHKNSTFWIIGLIVASALFFAQIYFFESYSLTQNQKLRPWLLQLCQTFKCQIPEYRNPEEISILSGSLERTSDQSYRFKAVISNQAEFKQRYPDIKLTLLDFTGKVFAERVFSAHNYRFESGMLAVDETVEIKLNIATPDGKIGGYTFKLL